MYYRRKKSYDLREKPSSQPDAIALVRGSADFPEIYGAVRFYQTPSGAFVVADVEGLPAGDESGNDIFAFHIHGGDSCSGNREDEFADAGTHYNPDDSPHPYHRGDMPPLFTAGKRAFSAFLTDRFTVDEIIGRTVIIHDSPDDFTTQPSGNAGNKIACGEIVHFHE